jgi:hypothetical protein
VQIFLAGPHLTAVSKFYFILFFSVSLGTELALGDLAAGDVM